MPFRTAPLSNMRYGLIAFDAQGVERADDPDGDPFSKRLLDQAQSDAVTDVFLCSHGWMGDMRAAESQYDAWIGQLGAVIGNASGIRPMAIGMHWPSKPWGDENFAITEALSGSPEARAELAVLLDRPPSPETPKALARLASAIGLETEGVGGEPMPLSVESGDDNDPYAETEMDYGGALGASGITKALRVFSFWSMKKRARTIGEGAMNRFVASVQKSCGARIHLMGHSFGCVIVSSILNGENLIRPIDSVVLVQGALSLWSYTAAIPYLGGKSGYFHRVISGGVVKGPIVTTYSRWDHAVGIEYPIASREVDFAAPGLPPKHGAVGACGLAVKDAIAGKMLPAGEPYQFEPGRVHNLDASDYICEPKTGLTGAHNDIARPEVAQVIWQAALANSRQGAANI